MLRCPYSGIKMDPITPQESRSSNSDTPQGTPSLNRGFSSFLTRQNEPSQNPEKTYNHQQYEPLYKAVRSGDLDAAKEFLADRPDAVRATITSLGETPLHIAALFGHLNIVEELLQLLSVDDLELADAYHSTALHIATYTRNIKVAKCLVERNKNLVTISSGFGWIPVTLALDFGHTEMGRYLYSVTPLDVLLPEKGNHGTTLLNQCYYSKMLDIALDLLIRCPRLAVTRDGPHGPTFLDTLATVPSAFQSGSKLSFRQRWIYKWVHVRDDPLSVINEIRINNSETDTRKNDYTMRTSTGLWNQLVSNTFDLLGIKKIYEVKLAHKQSLQLLRAACHVISTLNEEEIQNCGIPSSILLAAKRGIPEFIMEAIKVHFPFLWARDEKLKHIFFLAVEFRQANAFSLVNGLTLKDVIANYRDSNGNYLLHMAGLPAPPTQLNNISGAVLQMQRELQWFKEVESIMSPIRKESLNEDKMTARDLFTMNHKDLVEKGERWTKETASSCTVVAALVATITFAAAFTVPGGNDQNTGYPMFLQKKLFILFIISDAVSLFSSSTSVLIFLGLLTSRYAEDDFLKSLPTKLIIGLSTLFISTATMMIAFCAALFLVVHGKLWIGIPVTLLACAPVTLFVWLQFPLLVEFIMSTYRPGIFDKNVKPWP